MVGPDVARRCFIVLDVDGAGVAHPNCVTGLGRGSCIFSILLLYYLSVCTLYLAQCEYDILVILAHVVHTWVVPGRNVVLWDLGPVRSVTFVVTL